MKSEKRLPGGVSAAGLGAVLSSVFAILRGVFASDYAVVLAAQIGIAVGQRSHHKRRPVEDELVLEAEGRDCMGQRLLGDQGGVRRVAASQGLGHVRVPQPGEGVLAIH